MSDGSGDWVEKDAFVMPELPESLAIDPVVAALLHVCSFLELSGDDAVNPDWAVEAMENVGHYLSKLPARKIRDLRNQIERASQFASQEDWPEDAADFLENFLENFGIEDDDE
jgi:hypothetical protein